MIVNFRRSCLTGACDPSWLSTMGVPLWAESPMEVHGVRLFDSCFFPEAVIRLRVNAFSETGWLRVHVPDLAQRSRSLSRSDGTAKIAFRP